MKKISLKNIENALKRDEMKQVSGGGSGSWNLHQEAVHCVDYMPECYAQYGRSGQAAYVTNDCRVKACTSNC